MVKSSSGVPMGPQCFKMGNVRLYLVTANKVSGLSLRWLGIGHIQTDFKRSKRPKINKMSLKMGHDRLYLVITPKI